MDIILFGPPACGKGTQAEGLTHFGYEHFSTGELFRRHMRRKTQLGREIEDLMSRGELVPDSITIEMVKQKLFFAEPWHRLIFDGFPRTVEQAKALDVMAADNERTIGTVFNLVVPEHTLVARMEKRADECGRPEDNREAFALRLKDYHQLTEPVLAHYGERVFTINGLRSPAEVQREILVRLGEQQISQQSA